MHIEDKYLNISTIFLKTIHYSQFSGNPTTKSLTFVLYFKQLNHG